MKDIHTYFRNPSAGDLEATENGPAVFLGPAPAVGTPVAIDVPEQDAGADTLTVTFEESADGATGWREFAAKFPVVTGTGDAAAPQHIKGKLFNTLDHVRIVLTVTGSTPNFGAVSAAVDVGAYANVLGRS